MRALLYVSPRSAVVMSLFYRHRCCVVFTIAVGLPSTLPSFYPDATCYVALPSSLSSCWLYCARNCIAEIGVFFYEPYFNIKWRMNDCVKFPRFLYHRKRPPFNAFVNVFCVYFLFSDSLCAQTCQYINVSIACGRVFYTVKTLFFTHFFQRVHPIEADRFEMYKNSSKKRPPKSSSVSDMTRQTKLFETSPGRTSDASVEDLIVKFIINGLHPLSTVEEPGFVALVTGVVSLHSKLHNSCQNVPELH